MLKKITAFWTALALMLALSACSLEKLSSIELPPFPGTAAAAEAAAQDVEEQRSETQEHATSVGDLSEPASAQPESSAAEEQNEPNTEQMGPADDLSTTDYGQSEPDTEPSAADSGPSEPDTAAAAEEESAFQAEKTEEALQSPPPEPSYEPQPPAQTEPAPVSYAVPVISITNETKPSHIIGNRSFNIYGIIQTDCGVITQVYAVIIDSSGEAVQDCARYPDTASFDLANTVNYSLRFGALEPGNYIYQLNASAQNGDKTSFATLIDAAFSVGEPVKDIAPLPAAAEDGAAPGEEAPIDPSQYFAKTTGDGSNAGQIWNYLIGQLNNPFAAAGIPGNIQAESSCLPYAVENDTSKGLSFSKSYAEDADNGVITRDIFAYSPPGDSLGYGFGICQWSMERKGRLYDYAKDGGLIINSVDTQCGFLMKELNEYFPSLLEYLKTCTDAREACRRFCTEFEKAAVWGGRTDYAVEYLEKYAKN